jgi:hypothetical protein
VTAPETLPLGAGEISSLLKSTSTNYDKFRKRLAGSDEIIGTGRIYSKRPILAKTWKHAKIALVRT